ncbi:MAG: type III-A CRISPR-associated RAMP protein Csm5 [Bacteroidota bacterium]
MKLQLHTLTPLHIGNGQELHATDYVVVDDYYYRVSEQQFMRFLKQQGQEAQNLFSKWVIETAQEIDDLEFERRRKRQNFGRDKNQQLSYLKRNYNYAAFAQNVLGQETAFQQFLDEYCVATPIGNPNTRLKQQIRAIMRTADGRAYVPGSSLKGAIRTALLYHQLCNHIPQKRVEQILENSLREYDRLKAEAKKRNRRVNKQRQKVVFAKTLQNEAFYCGWKNERGRLFMNDEKYDLLKLLQVTDDLQPGKNCTVENLDIYLVDKVRKRGDMDIIANKQPQAPAIEAIQAGEQIEVEINFNIDFLFNLKQQLGDRDELSSKKELHWIGVKKKVQQLYHLDIDTLTAENLEEKRQAVLQHVLNCVRKFSERQLEDDENWLNHFLDHDDARKYTNEIEDGFYRVSSQNGRTLLNLGFASGFGGVTALFYFLDQMPALFTRVMELFEIGDHPLAFRKRKPGQRYQANPDDFPKSKRLVTRRDEIIPLGWLEIRK